MIYLTQYLEEKLKIKPLGTVSTEDYEESPCVPVGETLIIDGINTGIVIWYVDYMVWLEEKYSRMIE